MADLLETYSLSYKKNGNLKDYKLKFKVAKNVSVTSNTVGAINEIHLTEGGTTSGVDHKKNYNITGPLNIQFFEHPAAGSGKGDASVRGGHPDLRIFVEP
ncbi:MAG: hypothetical protein KAH07_01675 [Flavobacteriaceae bacterium]|nr:hypothetical protein [Flavobacteriaceae bacterium]